MDAMVWTSCCVIGLQHCDLLDDQSSLSANRATFSWTIKQASHWREDAQTCSTVLVVFQRALVAGFAWPHRSEFELHAIVDFLHSVCASAAAGVC